MISLSVLIRSPLPFLGNVTAGWPSPAEEELGDTITFENWLLPNKESSCLVSVSTDAMRDAGILPGDTLITERHRTPANGDIVIAKIDGETIMRRYHSQNGHVVFIPANSSYKSIIPRESATIIGVVMSVIRKYN